jgi:hypothetical protein
MKKIRLNVADLDATEVLSRDQLKTVFGGSTSGSSPKVKACEGKSYGTSCSWTYEGKTYSGKCCGSFMGSSIHCTDLNCYS